MSPAIVMPPAPAAMLTHGLLLAGVLRIGERA